MPLTNNGQSDEVLERISNALRPYAADHPTASIRVMRSNPYSVRIRVIDPIFSNMSISTRHKSVWLHLETLNDDDLGQVSQLLLFTPEELQSSANADFDESIAASAAERVPA